MRLRSALSLLLISCLATSCVFTDAEVIAAGAGSPDQDTSDLGASDMGQLPDDGLDQAGPDAGCEPLDAAVVCAQLGAQCGEVLALDSCGGGAKLECPGSCGEGERCVSNKCEAGCAIPSPEVFCNMGFRQLQCGEHPYSGCEQTTLIDCGVCEGVGESCTPDGSCACEAETEEELCAVHALQCGDAQVTDRCGAKRDVDCGACDEGACKDDNSCSTCQPESNAAFCLRHTTRCGVLTEVDNCGKGRMDVDCGACAGSADQCVAGQCVCEPEPDAKLCSDAGAQCGSIIATDRCGVTREVMCGAPDQACPPRQNTSAACTAANQCCYPQEEERVQRQQLVQQGRCGAQQINVCAQQTNIFLSCAISECCSLKTGLCVPLLSNDADECVTTSRDMGQDMSASDMASDLGSGVGRDADM